MSGELYDPAKHGEIVPSNGELYDPAKHGALIQRYDVPSNEGISTPLAYGSQGAASALSDMLDSRLVRSMNPVKHLNDLLTFAGVPNIPNPTVREGLNAYKKFASEMTGIGNPDFPATYSNINEVPERFRPAARFGEVVGSTLPMLAPVLGGASGLTAAEIAAKTGGGVLGGVWRSIVGDAAQNPKAFMVAQTLPTLGQAVGAYGAESVAPGDPNAQTIAQLGGGGIGGLLSAAGKGGLGALGSVYNRFTEPFTTNTAEGVKSAAAARLGPILQTAKENPEVIIDALKKPQIVPGLTAADQAQSGALTDVQKALAKDNPTLANKVAAGRQAYQTNLRQGFEGSFEPGQQTALTEAAVQRQAKIQQSIEQTIAPAEQEAVNAAAGVQPNTPQQRELLNIKARDVLEWAVAKARGVETSLWKKPDKTEILPKDGTTEGYNLAREGLLPGESLPGPIEASISAIQKGQIIPTLGFLQNLRSRALDMARDLRSGANPNRDMARRLDIFANGRFSDVPGAPREGGVLSDLSASAQPAAQTAREYSRALNDRITRSYAGDILGMKATGGERVRPELTLEAATTGASPKVASQLQELQTATVPIRSTPAEMASGAAMAPAQQMQQMQEQFLRTLSQGVVGSDGRVVPAKVDAFLKQHAPLLDQFPQYRTALINARDAQLAFEGVVQRTGDYQKRLLQEGAFAKVLAAGENPSAAVAKAVSGPAPLQDMSKIAALARMGGPDAVGGLRAATLEHVMDKSMANGAFSYGKARTVLNDPLSPNGPSLMQTLKDSGVISAAQEAAIMKHVDAGMLQEAAKVSGVKVQEFGQEPGMAVRYLAKVIGVKLASRLGMMGGGAGPSLQIANMVSNVAEKLVANMPADKAKQFMAEALSSENPAALQDILERVTSYNIARQKGTSDATKALVMSRAAIPRDQTKVERTGKSYMRPAGLLVPQQSTTGLLQ